MEIVSSSKRILRQIPNRHPAEESFPICVMWVVDDVGWEWADWRTPALSVCFYIVSNHFHMKPGQPFDMGYFQGSLDHGPYAAYFPKHNVYSQNDCNVCGKWSGQGNLAADGQPLPNVCQVDWLIEHISAELFIELLLVFCKHQKIKCLADMSRHGALPRFSYCTILPLWDENMCRSDASHWKICKTGNMRSHQTWITLCPFLLIFF